MRPRAPTEKTNASRLPDPSTDLETADSGSPRAVSAWRTIVAVATAQVVCTVVAERVFPAATRMQTFVIGFAVGTIAGLFIGLVWRAPRPAPVTGMRRVRLFLPIGLAALCIPAMVCLLAYRQAGQARLLERLTQLQPADVRSITISRRNDVRNARVIGDQAIIREFLEACRDAQSFSPNHPSYYSTWLVTIQTEEVLQLECNYEAKHSDLVIGSFVRAHPSSTSYYGSFCSRGLRVWFDRHVSSSQEDGPPAR
jgi:hypothetical protein